MLTRRAIRREYDEAGSVNALLALWAFVDEGTFVTKAGDVGVVYRLQGQDYEGLDHAQRRHVVHRFEAALRLLSEHSRMYQYFFKRQAPPITAAACASSVVIRPCGRGPHISTPRPASCSRWTSSSC